jgi:hypothetical protein
LYNHIYVIKDEIGDFHKKDIILLYLKWFKNLFIYLFEYVNCNHIFFSLRCINKNKNVNFTKRLQYLYIDREFELFFSVSCKNTFYEKQNKFLYKRNFFIDNRLSSKKFFSFGLTSSFITSFINLTIIFQFYRSLFWRLFYTFSDDVDAIEKKLLFNNQISNQHFVIKQLHHSIRLDKNFFRGDVYSMKSSEDFFYKINFYTMNLLPEKCKHPSSNAIRIHWTYDLWNINGFDCHWFIIHRSELNITDKFINDFFY